MATHQAPPSPLLVVCSRRWATALDPLRTFDSMGWAAGLGCCGEAQCMWQFPRNSVTANLLGVP